MKPGVFKRFKLGEPLGLAACTSLGELGCCPSAKGILI